MHHPPSLGSQNTRSNIHHLIHRHPDSFIFPHDYILLTCTAQSCIEYLYQDSYKAFTFLGCGVHCKHAGTPDFVIPNTTAKVAEWSVGFSQLLRVEQSTAISDICSSCVSSSQHFFLIHSKRIILSIRIIKDFLRISRDISYETQ